MSLEINTDDWKNRHDILLGEYRHLVMQLVDIEALEISHGERISKLRETIAAQAAMIEKLRTAYVELENFAQSVGGSSCFWEDMNDVLEPASCIATPTDSKEVLKEWLDSVMGEPVGWLQTNVEDGGATTLVRNHMPAMFNPEWWKFEPLFRKPEVK